jgi:hypothetical protein
MSEPSAEHTQGMREDDAAESPLKPMDSGKAEGMRGMGGLPSEFDAVAARGELHCDFCGGPADHQTLQQIGDGERLAWLHRR